jgi:hypothetical protein
MDWFILLLLAALVWFWIDSLRALDAARHAGKLACKKYDVQFLDDAVSGIALEQQRGNKGDATLYHLKQRDMETHKQRDKQSKQRGRYPLPPWAEQSSSAPGQQITN